EVPPPGAPVCTVIFTLPAFATSVEGTVARRLVAERSVVASGVLPAYAVVPRVKPVPVIVTATAEPPAVIVLGATARAAGVGFLTSNANGTLTTSVPSETVMLTRPASAIALAGTVAVSCVALTYVVGSAAPLNAMIDCGAKPVPVTPSGTAGSPTVTL